ncbi:MAG: family 78 glycoside hydrolase catalytic domain, partial [Myxococcota bacterium]|nr:family 78 glycoside hydrolase catalytic domain [Myxococcota bacterium]
MDAAAFPRGRWRARWIWCEAPSIRSEPGAPLTRIASGESVTACFRRSFDLDAVPTRVAARASADSRYALWVNGREVMRGPIRANGRRLHYDAFDLAPFLRRGRNAIAVLVRHFGRANPWWAPLPPTLELGAGGFVFEARLADDHWLVSDAAWRTLRADAWTSLVKASVGALPVERFDARALAAEWRETGFDDATWSPARALAGNHLGFTGRHEPPLLPYGAMRPRPIAPLGCVRRDGTVVRVARAPAAAPGDDPIARAMEDFAASRPVAAATHAWPLRLDTGPDAVSVVSVDFGEVVAGTVVLDVDAPAGTVLDVAAAEFASEEGVLAPDDERSGFRYVARGADDRFETFQPLGFRWLGLSVRADGPVVLRDVSVHERLYPRDPDAGPFFECSDATLNRIHAVGRRSVDLNSQDAYLDCPTREQRAWTGDSVVHQMVDFATHPDWRLACWNPELAASPRADGMLPMAAGGDIEHQDASFIPDWALHWVRAVHNVWRWTGDRERVARLLPVVEGVLRWFEDFAAEDGLASDVTGWVIIDWSSVSVDGKSSVLNALWARGLRDFAEMAEWLGDAGRAQWARARHARLREAFELFWDPERALYVDHAIGSERRRPVSQHALATPLAAGLVPDERVARVIEVLLDESRHVHATWSRAKADARQPGPGERGVGGPYLVLGPPAPWWDVERQIVVAQPFFAYVLHDALAEHGRADRIPAQCRRWAALLERCATSWSETWYGGTVSHGWGSTPTRDLVVRTLGITPAEPGFTRARIAPRLGDL